MSLILHSCARIPTLAVLHFPPLSFLPLSRFISQSSATRVAGQLARCLCASHLSRGTRPRRYKPLLIPDTFHWRPGGHTAPFPSLPISDQHLPAN
ncbi:hypothetical protein BCV70DRAFT_126540 [Testicularia cyperi]|uniref:Uncharacterized protein n=1 Tax=Testicularia cyperi TaxID=1882483 RepID=A0A317XP87_9BASI|nr:hypothetical protein BCV70DRAFT_126540 [Testicularia cyperi]